MEATRALGNLPKRNQAPQHPKATLAVQLEYAISITRHQLVRLANGGWHCAVCWSRSGVQRKHQVSWLSQPCCPDLREKQVFGSKPHHSHQLSHRQDGLLWCVRCGSWSGRIYRALKSKCLEQPKSSLQQLALARLAKGLDPPGHDCGSVVQPPAKDQATELHVEGLDFDSE